LNLSLSYSNQLIIFVRVYSAGAALSSCYF